MTGKSRHQTEFRRAAEAPTLPASVSRFVLFCLSGARGWLVLMWLLETGQAACNILVPYAIGQIMNGVTAGGAGSMLERLQTPLLWFVGLNLGELLFSRASGAILIMLGPRLRQRTTSALYAYLQFHSVRFFSRHFAGALAHRISETTVSVNHLTWLLLCDFWPIGVTFGVSTLLLFQAHAHLGEFIGAWTFAYVAISWWLATRCQPYAREYAAVRSQINGKIVDALTNALDTKLFARLQFERDYLDDYLEHEVKTGRRVFWYMDGVRWFQFTAAGVLRVGTLYYALTLWDQGAIGVGAFTMSVGLALLVINEARNLSRRFLEFFEYAGNIANGVHSVVQPHEIVDAPNAEELKVLRGRIEFRGVHFGYQPEQPVFDGLDVVIEPGQRVGLVGFSGSGKSTFLGLLLRYYEPQAGQIMIDGADITQVTQDSLHRQVSLIPQDPSLFHRSLRENIRYGRLDAGEADLVEAARMAHADEFIGAMREGFDALVGERGVKLSGGQRQRIAIARVILKDAPILLLDEATSSLDSVTEKAIQENLDRLMGQKTVIAIAHRLSTIAHLDRILVFDMGRIVEDGRHEELLARCGFYHRLWTMQTGGFLPESERADPAE